MTRRRDPTALTKRETALLERMRAGAVLCCQVGRAEGYTAHEGRRWFVEPGGRSVGPKTATRLIRRAGLVQPNVAGLFGASDAQTYEAVRA